MTAAMSNSSSAYTVKVRSKHRLVRPGIGRLSSASQQNEHVVRLKSARLDDLKASAAAAFGLWPTSANDNNSSSSKSIVSLSYMHPGGGKAFLDDDADLVLAFDYWRYCSALTVSADWGESTTVECKSLSPDKIRRLYHEAAGTLRTCHGVGSATAASLKETVNLLNLPPRRLITQGLTPRFKAMQMLSLTTHDGSMSTIPEGMAIGGGNEESDDAPETTGTAGIWEDDSDPMSDHDSVSEEHEERDDSAKGGDDTKNPVHAALLSGGVNVDPRETSALLHALGVDPERLVSLGLMKRDILNPPTAVAPRVKIRGSFERPGAWNGRKAVQALFRLAGSKRAAERPVDTNNARDAAMNRDHQNMIEARIRSKKLFTSVSCPQLTATTSATQAEQQRSLLTGKDSGRAQSVTPRRGRGSPGSRRCVQARAWSVHTIRGGAHCTPLWSYA